jgi:uncharacterized protein DUF1501
VNCVKEKPVMPQQCSGPISRREFLRIGLALGGLGLGEVAAARAAAKTTSDTAVILIYCLGGPSQLETYDIKPDGPAEMRSAFKPIASRVPGMSVCELLPLHAQVADRFSLIRSLHHDINIHNDGSILTLTGKPPTVLDPTSTAKSEHPDFGMITSKLRGPHRDSLPQYVSVPMAFHMIRPNYLGSAYQPFATGDVSQPGYAPPLLTLRGQSPQVLENRRRLLEQLDQAKNVMDFGPTAPSRERDR